MVMYYPSAVYFFVDKNNLKLYEALKEGLKTALKDGSWQILFDKHFAKTIERVQLKKRTLIRLKNPLLPRTAPTDIPEYWYEQ
jgi:hypothetical protein